MHRNCCLCGSRSTGDVSLHQVPTDPKKNRQWLRSIRKKYPHFKMSQTKVLCSRHFLPKYVTRGKKVELVEHAVPTIFDFSEKTNITRKPPLERTAIGISPIPAPTAGVNVSSPDVCNTAPKIFRNASLPEKSVITKITSKNDCAERKKSPVVSAPPLLAKLVVGSKNSDGKTVPGKSVSFIHPSFVSSKGNGGASGSQPVIPPDVMKRVLQILNKRKAEQKLPNTSKIQKLIPVSALPVLPGGSKAAFSTGVKSGKATPIFIVLPQKNANSDEKQVPHITSVDPDVTILADRNEDDDESPAVVPLSVQPDVRARALEILAKRKEKNPPCVTHTSATVKEGSILQTSQERILTKEQRLQATLKNRSRQMKSMRQKMHRLVKKVDSLKRQKAQMEEKSTLRLSESLPFDLEGLLTSISRRTKQKYSPEIKDFAMALHKISPRAYSFVRQNFLDMLPSYATIRQWRIDMKSERNVPLQETEKLVPAENSSAEIAAQLVVQDENYNAEIAAEQVVYEEIIDS